MYKIRVILDSQEDVIRTLLVDRAINLETLHFTIAKAFGFEGSEMASFYRADNEWNQGEEIPLFNMSEAGEGISMQNCFLRKTIPNAEDKLIYVYDFFKMWTFYVEVLEVTGKTAIELPKTILSIGEIPAVAPENEFVSENFGEDTENEFGDEFDSFEDFDLDNY